MKAASKAKPKADYSKTHWGCLSQQWAGVGRLQQEAGGLSCRMELKLLLLFCPDLLNSPESCLFASAGQAIIRPEKHLIISEGAITTPIFYCME